MNAYGDPDAPDKATADLSATDFAKTTPPPVGPPRVPTPASAPAPAEAEPPILVEDDAAVEGEQFAKVTT